MGKSLLSWNYSREIRRWFYYHKIERSKDDSIGSNDDWYRFMPDVTAIWKNTTFYRSDHGGMRVCTDLSFHHT